MPTSSSDTLCPCNSNKPYKGCCQPLHDGLLLAHSAEQLMCSRYSAFVLEKVSYLITTLHPDQHEVDDKDVLKHTIENTHWLGLKIIKHSPNGNEATVEFVAFYQDETDIGQLHEKSSFVCENDHWLYRDGEIMPKIKLSRNETCFCGSGKKVKKCHTGLL